MKLNIKYIAAFVLLSFEFMLAQGGPIYSRYGIGDQIHSSTARRLGFGSTGSAVIDRDYIDGYNPASWTDLGSKRKGSPCSSFPDGLLGIQLPGSPGIQPAFR